MKKSLILASAMLLGMTGVAHSFYFENSTPHNFSRMIECEDCHGAPVWGDPNGSKPFLLNNVSQQGDTDCKVCHKNDTGQNYTQTSAPFEKTHSSKNISERYGKWGFECWNCHQNHDATPQTADPKAVDGTYSTMIMPPGGMLFSINSYTVYKDDGSVNNCLDMNDNKWCTPNEWSTKTFEQTPYDPFADPLNSLYTNGPCDPNGSGYDPNYNGGFCNAGVKPNQRGLILWVTLDSGTRAGFEVIGATTSQIEVVGQPPAGESVVPNSFELRYGMMVTSQVDTFGFCSPDPIYTYCFDSSSGDFFSECASTADCSVGETCEPRALETKCTTDADCSNGGTCITQTPGPIAFEFPEDLAYNENFPSTDQTPNGVCQVCHTRTLYWLSDGTGTNHNNGQVCTRCHIHTAGFAPSGECNSCHGYPPTQSEYPIVYVDGTSGSKTAGAHQFHATQLGYSFQCSNCHEGGMLSASEKDNLIEIGFNPFNIGGDGTVYYGQADVADPSTPYNYKGTNGTTVDTSLGFYTPPSPSRDPNFLSCQNVYCHSQGKRLVQGFDLPSASPPWDDPSFDIQEDGFKCNNCHGYPPTFDAHKFHVVRNFGCELCHADTTNDGVTISDRSKHVNGEYNVVAGSTFFARKEWHPLAFQYTFAPGGGTCSSNTCHQYFRFKDPKEWLNKPQEFTNAQLNYAQGAECTTGGFSPTNPLPSSTVSIDVSHGCGDCEPFPDGDFRCDFDWGDGTQDTDVSCTTTHDYVDAVPRFSPDGGAGVFEIDPTGYAIGGFDVTWSMRDLFGVQLPEGSMMSRIEVCPEPNVMPAANFSIALGPDPSKYDACITDLSTDPDFNVGTHYDANNPPYYAAGGTLFVDWGGFPADGSGVDQIEYPVILTDSPSNQQVCFDYKRSGFYWIKHCVTDNGGDEVCSPLSIFKVTK